MHLSTHRPASTFPRSERGALLIVAMLLCAAIGIFLASYISLGQNSLKLSNRSFYSNAAANIAETGIEEAMWSFNQTTNGSTTAWGNWTISGAAASRTFTDLVLSGNVNPRVQVYVDNYSPGASVQPMVVALARISVPNESRFIYKMVEVRLRRRSKFAMGLVAKNQITFNGNNATVDSWNSDSNNDGTSETPYSTSSPPRNDHGSVGSTSVAVGSVAINNADIWGYASVGTSGTTGISVGANGTVSDFTHPAGYVDTTRIATDFSANFDDATMATSAIINSCSPITGGDLPMTLPRITDLPSTDGKYYIRLTSIQSSGNATNILTIDNNKSVVLLLTAAQGNDAISLTGNASMAISSGANLEIYAAGDVKIAGNGVTNANNYPSSMQIWGTATSSAPNQTVDVTGNGALKAIVYAPNSNVKIGGNGDVMGSIVGNNITVVGNASFHYDESLANWGGSNPYGIVSWKELTSAADRNTYSAIFGVSF